MLKEPTEFHRPIFFVQVSDKIAIFRCPDKKKLLEPCWFSEHKLCSYQEILKKSRWKYKIVSYIKIVNFQSTVFYLSKNIILPGIWR